MNNCLETLLTSLVLPRHFKWFKKFEIGFWKRPGGWPTTAIAVDQQANIAIFVKHICHSPLNVDDSAL